jgi:glucokinase
MEAHGARLSFLVPTEVEMAVRTRGPIALGIDLGGTKTLAGAVDGAGKILGRGKLKTPFESDAAALTEALVEASDLALNEAGASRESVSALAVAAPGAVDAEKGVLIRAGNLAVKNWNIVKALGGAFPNARRRLGHDVRLAALAEARLGAGRGASTMVAVWVGTGVGGAVIIDGKIHTGRNRNAGEIGQIQIDFRRAEPGKPDGTLEGIAAKVGITRYLQKRIGQGEKTVLEEAVMKKGRRLKTSELKEACESGDELAIRAVKRSAKAVGMAMANVFNVFSPDVFVLGGGVAVDVGASYLADVRRWAEAFAFTQELGKVRVEPAALGDDAGLLGAALYALE